MNIETKFDVGQKVIVIGRDWRDEASRWICYNPAFEILGIYTATTKNLKVPMVSYNLDCLFRNPSIGDMFATQAEAQAECDKRNEAL